MQTQTAWKLAAARAAVAAVPSGAVLGLGSGSTAELMLAELAGRVRAGLRVTGVPTSERTRAMAASLGIALATLDDVPRLDMSIDGADEVALPGLELIKGRGGALLREKLIATASNYRVIITDATKVVPTLALRHPIPVEVEPFGWQHTARRLVDLGARPERRRSAADPAAPPFLTDGGHYVLDCAFGPVAEPAELAARIKAVVGVVDHGLFIDLADRVYVAGPAGIQVYDCPR
ncbi:MAG: ribose-5-phosphate isomerase RpiA [Ktedonobacterales bacterium]|nr:ribose-5-phosphate isomerase RpiA [Ktedonobacterales bacterium]